ncbi:MAG: YggS family pyridoxal phosphate-dependent enzyme [Elusimicrobiota bacterium]|nr:YggS family pyridoxal phosphate-dependent enzyme [Elusimicrobiota bacterium]
MSEKYGNLRKEVEKFGKNIRIVVVTKYVDDIEIISKLADVGITEIAESYAQQMLKKYNELQTLNAHQKYIWHFVGHLQKNKVNKVVPLVEYIQSVDSIELAEKINTTANKLNKVCNCLVELKVSEEETKFGVKEDEIFEFVESLISKKFSNIQIVGLMTMAPYFDNPELTRPYFKRAYEIFCKLKTKIKGFDILSMGMSNDYRVALEEGSNMLRIGSLLFS